MVLDIRQTTAFGRDLKRLKRQQKSLIELFNVVELLAKQESLDKKYRDHTLTSNWQGYRECRIRPDWLLICRIEQDTLILARSGSHAELF
jgi:mRNA interferase YafQ